MKNKLQVFNKHALSTMAIQLLALGKANGWHFQSLGRAPVPTAPIHLDGWVVIPAEQDTQPMLDRTKYRINTVFASGIRPQAWVVIHEAPALLPAPKPAQGIEHSRASIWPVYTLFCSQHAGHDSGIY